DGGLAEQAGQVPVAFLGSGAAVPLPDWLSSGLRPAQEARCPGVGNLVMSAPVSAASWAARRPHPGTDPAWASCSSCGASSRSITSVSWPISALTRSMRSSMAASSTACAGEELRAFQRLFQLADLAARAGAGQLGQRLGVPLPGGEVAHDVPV